ncbi:hypothetical protein LZD49_35385 [Dyadobacter sp. CY261]|uniref:hypothetical protein n=1 Tax=Dyadobacter sp. CY261 TaxID=2907203 RepID=UPI001F23834E|nr:hypothetical protein [Dyadobacter sp. CY261]MCF0075804.1 hypothetical protein [Dyadobacter sp. CY261]
MLANTATSAITHFPDWQETNNSLEKRARAYLDVNCAHCHQPAGNASETGFYVGYELPYSKTGIADRHEDILNRMASKDRWFHMPRLGTTIIDQVGLQLIRAYIKQLQ